MESRKRKTKHDGISPQLLASTQQAVEEATTDKSHPLESSEAQEKLKKLIQYRRQARVAQAENRTQMAIDEDFYDGIQLESDDLKILLDRGQPPLVFNVIKNTLNWILGTERKSRIDYRVLPRKKKGAAEAKTKTKIMKYISDVSKGEYARSEAFTEAAIAGMGWIETGARESDEIIFMRSERWRNMWFDHLSIRADGSDMRYVIREKWIDLDIAQAMYPDRAEALKVMAEAVNSLYPYNPDDTVVTDNATEFDLESDLDSMFGGPFDGMRERLKLIEMEYRVPKVVQVMRMMDNDTPYGALDGSIYRASEADHEYLIRHGYFRLTDPFKKLVTHKAQWSGRIFLTDGMSPYNHNRFSFVPIFCYRRKRDNMPYGIIRDLRDPQSDLNRRKSKSLFLMSANQIVMEEGTTNNIPLFHKEMQSPDGIGVINAGKMQAWKQVDHLPMARNHVELAQDDERFIHSVSGVTADADWQQRKDLSGVAMGIQEKQSMTSHGVVFDNYYYSFQHIGEIILSMIEQFYDKEMEVRITGDQQKDEFVEINKPKADGSLDNNITAQKSDFIVSKQDYRETVRLQMMQQLFDLITSLAKTGDGQVALSLLDLAVELMTISRIRMKPLLASGR